MTALPAKEQLESCVDEPFLLSLPDGTTERLMLAQVEEHGPHAFSALFRGRPGFYAPQQIWTLEHDRLGEFELFLVPLQPDADGSQFEAVFNRLPAS